jgi:hypothetical protein
MLSSEWNPSYLATPKFGVSTDTVGDMWIVDFCVIAPRGRALPGYPHLV